LDLGGYHISGWTLFEAELAVQSIVATYEKEVVGSSSSPGSTGLRIYEHDVDLYYDQLAQEFYNQPHDGQLANFSVQYLTPTYSPAQHNYAYLELRSDYTDGSTNLIPEQQLPYIGFTPTWANATENVNLTADTSYWAVVNGSLLVEFSNIYPDIRWFYEDASGTYDTRRHNTDGDTWGSERPFEALLNYTYTPASRPPVEMFYIGDS